MLPLGVVLAFGAIAVVGLGVHKAAHGVEKVVKRVECVVTFGHKCPPKAKKP
jgi:hypothetical protein